MAEESPLVDEAAKLQTIGKYALGRDFLASIRLYFQHWMWLRQLGYLLSPQIPLHPGAKVADVCCGTGIWLLDLAHQHPDIQCDGFDISEDQYPAKGYLPKNVDLSTIDVLQPIPEHLRNQYDVVHVGNLVCVIQNDDPQPILENLKLMLKPGGYLQWDDSDFGNLLVSSATADGPHSALDEVNHRIHGLMTAANGAHYEWVRNLKQYFENSSMNVLDDRLVTPSDDIALPWTLQHLMALVEVVKTLDQPAGSATSWWDMYEAAAKETRSGASMRMGLVSCVGQKT